MGHYREILPKMVSISNNSTLTNRLSITLAENLNDEEFQQFQRWLQLVEQHTQIEKNNGIKKFRNL